MKSNKGQALVEFVLILPVVLMLLFTLIDYARVMYEKNHLESIINDSVLIYQDKGTLKGHKESDVTYVVNTSKEFVTLKLSKEVSLITPFSNLLFDNPYEISAERTFLYE